MSASWQLTNQLTNQSSIQPTEKTRLVGIKSVGWWTNFSTNQWSTNLTLNLMGFWASNICQGAQFLWNSLLLLFLSVKHFLFISCSFISWWCRQYLVYTTTHRASQRIGGPLYRPPAPPRSCPSDSDIFFLIQLFAPRDYMENLIGNLGAWSLMGL